MHSKAQVRSWLPAGKALLAALLLAGLLSRPASAQEIGFLSVETNLPDGALYVDSVYVGGAERRLVPVPAGHHEVRLAPRDPSWQVSHLTEQVAIGAGDTVQVRLFFPHLYRVETVPYGAAVVLSDGKERSALGRTPLLLQRDAPLEGTLVIEKEGFLPQRLAPGRGIWNRHLVLLKPQEIEGVVTSEIAWQPPKARNRWIDYAAAGLAVAAGITSVHYKFKADRLYDRYSQTGDADLRPQIKAYDVRAGIALAGMQVGVGVLAIRFALR